MNNGAAAAAAAAKREELLKKKDQWFAQRLASQEREKLASEQGESRELSELQSTEIMMTHLCNDVHKSGSFNTSHSSAPKSTTSSAIPSDDQVLDKITERITSRIREEVRSEVMYSCQNASLKMLVTDANFASQRAGAAGC
jgi:hypothetical protein